MTENIYIVGTFIYYNILFIIYGSCSGSNVIPIQSDENCLFRAGSYCMYNTEDKLP